MRNMAAAFWQTPAEFLRWHITSSSLLMKDGCWQKVYHQLRTRFQSGKIRQLERERQRKRRQHVMGPPHVIRRARHAHLHDRVAWRARQPPWQQHERQLRRRRGRLTTRATTQAATAMTRWREWVKTMAVVRTTATLAPTTISTKSKTQLRRRKTRRTRAKAPEKRRRQKASSATTSGRGRGRGRSGAATKRAKGGRGASAVGDSDNSGSRALATSSAEVGTEAGGMAGGSTWEAAGDDLPGWMVEKRIAATGRQYTIYHGPDGNRATSRVRALAGGGRRGRPKSRWRRCRCAS